MGPTLASEFLRNLSWSGFKPDRHVMRLLRLWFPDQVSLYEPRAQELGRIIGSRNAGLLEFLTFSLLGMAVTPKGCTFTQADGLIWALGANVEKKGKESSTRYCCAGEPAFRLDGRN